MKEAIKWYKLSAENKNSLGQYNYARCLFIGKGVEQDIKESIQFYQLSSDQGLAIAQYTLGLCYNIGDGIQKNIEESIRLFRLAAEQGHLPSQYRLGTHYLSMLDTNNNNTQWNRLQNQLILEDQKIKDDVKEGVRWLRLSAEGGYGVAQNDYGVCYLRGEGVEQNYRDAFQLFQAAALQDVKQAYNNLGLCYREGYGVQKNVHEAVRWYKKRSLLGDNLEADIYVSAFRIYHYFVVGSIFALTYVIKRRWFSK